jgi:hypothetical protein
MSSIQHNLMVMTLLIAGTISGVSYASDVYINHDHDDLTTRVDIVQTGSSNRIGTAAIPITLFGDTQLIDLVQTGSSNTIDINSTQGSDNTTINYTATGDLNVLNASINAATDTKFTSTVTGDSNDVTLCGVLSADALASTNTPGSCSGGITANTTTTILDITGDANFVALGLNAPGAVNTITVGGNVASNTNTINLSQTGNNAPIVTLNVDGNSNVVNITQQ